MKIAILGLGFVGTTSMLGFSHIGMKTIGIEKNLSKLDGFKKGKIPFYDNDIQKRFSKADGLSFISDIQDLDNDVENILVCVETPLLKDKLDLSILENAVKQICQLKKNINIWIRSTIDSPIEIIELSKFVENTGNKLFMYPEFMREGSCWKDFFDPAFTILAGDKVKETRFYKEISKKFNVNTCNYAEAITVKISSNAFHALKVTFANELKYLKYSKYIDINKVMKIFCTDKKLNISSKYLLPGQPFSGPCLKKDTLALSNSLSDLIKDSSIIKQINISNEKQIDIVIKKIENMDYKKIGFYGLEFKEGSGDIRNSYILQLINRIKGKKIHVFDENISNELENSLIKTCVIEKTFTDLLDNTDVVFAKSSSKKEKTKKLILLDNL